MGGPMPLAKSLFNYLTYPFRIFAPSDFVRKLGMKSMLDERTDEVLKFLNGTVLDMGCGENLLIKKYRELGGVGIGLDVYDFGGADVIVKDSSRLDFSNGVFDMVTMLATLNHIPGVKRMGVLRELYRVLGRNGLVIITCLPPVSGFFRHNTAWWDRDYHERLFSHGESHGLSKKQICEYMEAAGFKFLIEKKFTLNLNRLYIFVKNEINVHQSPE